MKDNEKIESHILDKYQILTKLGSGAYGHVWKAKNKRTGTVVALKKIFDAFQHSVDAQRTFREISILKQVSHNKIIKLFEVLPAQNNQDIYLVFEYMETDLYHLLYESKLQPVHVKYIMYQVLLAICHLHHNKIIHRDLKPSNILVNSDCEAKICDFGLVRFLGSQVVNQNTLTENVATRWYRAPEVLLGSNSYGVQADMWSLGCILAEIMLKTPLFPGNCTTNQLERILQLTGQPSPSDIKSIKAELGEVMVSEISNGKIKKKTDIFNKVEDKSAVDLIYKLLEFNPSKRLTASEALKHPYFSDFHNASDLQLKTERITMEVDENIRLETKDYFALIQEKYITKPREESSDKTRLRPSESPKSFSDLKKSRISSTPSSVSKSRTKTEEVNKILCPADTNLFKELIREKESSVKKSPHYHKRNTSKENSFNHYNNVHSNSTKKDFGLAKEKESFCGLRENRDLINKENKEIHKEVHREINRDLNRENSNVGVGLFAQVRKFGDDKKVGFGALRKTGKLPQQR